MADRPLEVFDPDCVIVVGGPRSHEPTGTAVRALAGRSAGAIVIAADSGLDLAQGLGLAVDHLVGDLDSASAEAIESAVTQRTELHRHPADKDATDFELAVDLVLELMPGDGAEPRDDPPRLLVLGPGGGRLDHLMADLALLGAAKLARFEVTAAFGAALVVVVRPDRPRRLPAWARAQASLLPVGGSASGITTTGLRWPLVNAELAMGSTRAVSNEIMGEATVAVGAGVLAVVLPGGDAPVVEARSTRYDPSPRRPR